MHGAGVDIAAGERAVELIKQHVRSTFRPEVVGDIGGFGGLFALRAARPSRPAARVVDRRRRHEVADRPPDRALRHDRHRPRRRCRSTTSRCRAPSRCSSSTTSRSASSFPRSSTTSSPASREGCRKAGCALLGGEMSEHPDLMEPGEFDLVGFAVGVVERARDPARGRAAGRRRSSASPAPGCAATATRSRASALLERAGRRLDEPAWRARTTPSATSCSARA